MPVESLQNIPSIREFVHALLSLLGSVAVTTGKLRVTGTSKEVGTEQETESERQASALEEPEQIKGVSEISEARTVTDTHIR